MKEGHGELVELFADLTDDTKLEEVTVAEDLMNGLFRQIHDGDFLLLVRGEHSLRRRHHPVTTWGLGRGDSLAGMEVRRHLGLGVYLVLGILMCRAKTSENTASEKIIEKFSNI